MLQENNRLHTLRRILIICLGNISYAMGVNLAINPLHFYSGGFTGIAQLLRMLFVDVLGIPVLSGIDYLGIIYFAINVPVFFFAYRIVGRRFCLEAIATIAMSSACLAIIPVPETPIITDPMLASIIGGIGSGVGAGLVLRAGSSQGGQDLIGVCVAKTSSNFKVGTIGIIISLFIYTICLFLYDVQTVLYSIIFAVVNGICVNRVHIQNIKLQVMIFTKVEGIAGSIMKELRRGVTTWEGKGAYTDEDTHILVTVISKYEEDLLREVVEKYDPNAFVILSDNMRVMGNFQKRFQEGD